MKWNVFGMLLTLAALVAAPLVIAGAWSGNLGQKPQQNDEYQLEGPFTHGNLSVFLVHGKDKIKGQTFLTLEEALIQKKVVVRETRTVNELAIENLSNEEVYAVSYTHLTLPTIYSV